MKKSHNLYNNFSLIIKKIIALINKATKDRKSPFHTPVLSTVDERYNPNSRTVVLRNFFPKEWIISIHSDIRTKKVLEIKKNPNICLMFYDPNEKIQVRLSCKARIEKNFNNAWEKLNTWSRRCYLSKLRPGENSDKLDSGFDKKFSKFPPTIEESELGRKNFCCIIANVEKIDWLFLSSTGNTRAGFVIERKNKIKIVSKKWMIP